MFEEGQIEPITRMLVQKYMNHCEQKCRIGFRLDWNPFRRACSRDREMGFNLHTFHAALAGIRVALDAAHSAGGLDIGAEGNEVLAERRIG